MNVKRFSTIALAVSTALVGASCNAQRPDTTRPYSNHDTTSTDRELPSFQSKYAITFTNFRINKVYEYFANPDSEYVFYVYNPEKNTYEFKCFNGTGKCQKKVWVSAKKGDTISLKMKVSEFANSDYVYLMVWEADLNYWNELKHTFTDQIKWVSCPQQRKLFGKFFTNNCLQIPVQYLLKNPSSCLKMATQSGSDEICLSYKIDALQKLHPEFQKNLEQLSALSGLLGSSHQEWVKFFENSPLYNHGQSVQFVDFSTLDAVNSQSVSSVTFYAQDKYAREKKFSELPTKIALPVVNYLAQQYPSGLWVINGAYEKVLAAYGANKLNQAGHSSPIQISVNWPSSVSHESINDWLKTPEKDQVYRPVHTLGLSYQRGDNATFAVKRITGLNDTVATVPDTLTLPGSYTLGTHLNFDKDNVELSGIFSLFNSEVTGNEVSGYSIKLTPKYEKVDAKLELPSGYEYRYKKDCRAISKTVSDWFATDKVTLRCPRLPQSLMVPEFVNGEVHLKAQNKELSLGLRFKNRAPSQSSLEGWHLKDSQITLSQTHQGQDNWMLINARDLPEPTDGHLTLEPPADAVSIFYLNEQIPVKLSQAQQDYLYTANSVPDLEGNAVVKVEVPNPKERSVETFKNSDNPWTPETLRFLCDGSQPETSLCGKTCRLDSTTAQNPAKLICQGKPVTMPLKQLEGYLVTTRFIGERWGTASVRLKGQSLQDFFCGAWQRLFPIHNQVIVVGSRNQKGEDTQVAHLSNPFSNQQMSQEVPLSAITDNQQPVWSSPIKPSEARNPLLNSTIWQLDAVRGRYDYYLHKDYGCKDNGQRLPLPIRSGAICQKQSQNLCQVPSASVTRNAYVGSGAQIDIVAVFADNYDFQQQPMRHKFSIKLPGLNLPKTSEPELRAGWMRTWNKPATQESLRAEINQQTLNQQRNPSVVLHYLYDDENDYQNKWLWKTTTSQARLRQAPDIKKRNELVNVVDISNVVLNNEIRPRNRELNNQVQRIIDHVTQQWRVNSEHLLVILSDSISEQEMARLNNIGLPRGNGKRRLLILTSEFLSPNSDSLLSLPRLPSDTGIHTVISMYDDNWVEQFVKAVFDF